MPDSAGGNHHQVRESVQKVENGGLMDMEWREHARCKDLDPELFFPAGSLGPAEAQSVAAKVICKDCTVKDACLRFALKTNQEFGIWGGFTEEERRAHRRQLAKV